MKHPSIAKKTPMKRIIIHWTGGTGTPNAVERKRYHFLIDAAGKVHDGNLKPEANRDCTDGNYAAHTRACNTASIGIGLCGMAGAAERPFDAGKHPLNREQFTALARLCADLCDTYAIAVARRSVLTHAEVEPTLAIKQRGKWDITWIPGMSITGDPVMIGDHLRKMIADTITATCPAAKTPQKPPRTSATQSTTIRASATQVAAGAGTAVTAVSALSGTAQIAALALAAIIVLAGIWIMRERLKHWAQGVR